MGAATFMQDSFTGGQWSPDAQGRKTDPVYKTALAVCLNGWPQEEGSWTRRPGFRFLGETRQGNHACLRAFDFTITQPYQMEFTFGHLRFWAGLALTLTDDVASIATITADNPAKVLLTAAVPAGWANTDFVQFQLNTEPCSAPALCGQPFQIGNVSGNTFTLTGVDGATLAYSNTGSTLDTVRKVLELTTPYAADDLDAIRTVQDQANVLVMHGDYQPRLVTAGVTPIPFQIAAQDFEDGPYLDVPKDNTTTITPGGTTGTVTWLANATTNINGGDGFKTTDVGRTFRFQGAPAAWDNGTAYAKDDIVLGSDENIYKSLTGANTGNDPTTDDGTNWQITDQTVTWTWVKFTAWTSTLQMSGTIMGPDLPGTAATTTWQLGLYSDTTGWPTEGSYHEGRLWLTSRAFPNRIDASVSNDYFNFSPTGVDGTVADNNGISAVFNANEVNAILGMVSTDDGLMLFAQGSEWRVKASVLDDPISPSNIQARKVSTYGAADVKPIQPSGQTVFVQRQGRKLMGQYQVTASRYVADNITRLADDITAPGIAEIAWQQEPSLNIWLRMDDDTLAGCVFKNAGNKDSFAAFHPVTHGGNHLFESISAGPSFDGQSDALYVVSYDAAHPQTSHRFVETLMPVFDSAADDCDAFFTDGGGLPCCTQIFQVSNGDSFNGLRVYGLAYLEGLSVSAFLAGMDLGDYTVADGYIDVPFTSTFTLAYFQSLDACDTLGSDASFTASTAAPNPNANSLEAFVGADTPVGYDTFGDGMAEDRDVAYIVQFAGSPGTGDAGLKSFNRDTTGNEIAQATLTDLGISGVTTPYMMHPNGNVYFQDDGTNSAIIYCVRASDLTFRSAFGAGDATLGSDGTHIAESFQMVPLRIGTSTDMLVSVGLASASHNNEVSLWATPASGGMTFAGLAHTTEPYASVCEGHRGRGNFFAIGQIDYLSGDTTPFTLYSAYTSGNGFYLDTIGTVSPAQVDATWTNFIFVAGPGYDNADGNVLALVTSPDAVTHTDYLIKINAGTGAVMWASAITSSNAIDLTRSHCDGILRYHDHSQNSVVEVDLSDGTQTLTEWNHGIPQATQFFDHQAGLIFKVNGSSGYTQGAGPVPTYLGSYLAGHSNAIPARRIMALYTDFPPVVTTTVYPFFGSIGFTYTSDGQLLPPDFGNDAGPQNGPAFGKMRRIHKASFLLNRSYGVQFGTSFSRLTDIALLDADGRTRILPPNLYSGTTALKDGTISDTYGTDSQICWRITRPWPCTVLAIGGAIQSADE